MSRPSHAAINLQALVNNYHWACQLAPNSKTMAIIKADAYGHGAVACGRALEAHVPAFGVACIEEAIQLRQADINKPILLLEGPFSADEVEAASEHNFWLMLENVKQVEAVLKAKLTKPVNIWLKIDTGMHRLGLPPDKVAACYTELKASPNVNNTITIASHFACADETEAETTDLQMQRFHACLPEANIPISLANSPGIMAWPQAHGNWNRAGYMLYGHSPLDKDHTSAQGLTSVMSLCSAVISIRDISAGECVGYGGHWRAQVPTQVATVAIGYGDGYPRHAPHGTPLLINGQRAPLIGRVSMDMITVDVSALNGVEIGTPVVCWNDQLPITEIAQYVGTIGYELMTRLGKRIPRVYN